ncbi:cysteine-rich venom protein helothermine-like [Tubulanus polymorphus]|uniref:cysteine-rich venom protein helothermine-like n=1 Tax=Tubulanus polymorphus TaxID=672921 RepID=UPI003DA40936
MKSSASRYSLLISTVQGSIITSFCTPSQELVNSKGYAETHSSCHLLDKRKKPGLTYDEQQLILNKHNELRGSVERYHTGENGEGVPASIMLKLIWNDEIAASAQGWANECGPVGRHDSWKSRMTKQWMFVGQNAAWNVNDNVRAISYFFDEYKNFVYNVTTIKDIMKVGHYTQLVWATTQYIGCGFAICGKVPYLMCNYGPGGNYRNSIHRPYPSGVKGSECPKPLVYNEASGLCELEPCKPEDENAACGITLKCEDGCRSLCSKDSCQMTRCQKYGGKYGEYVNIGDKYQVTCRSGNKVTKATIVCDITGNKVIEYVTDYDLLYDVSAAAVKTKVCKTPQDIKCGLHYSNVRIPHTPDNCNITVVFDTCPEMCGVCQAENCRAHEYSQDTVPVGSSWTWETVTHYL